ncbi:MAG: YidH family protein [Syntrophobacteraceae bacterium]
MDSGSAGENEHMDLPYEQSRLSADRTLMSWIRTSLSMISFGFTIFKFFQYLKESATSYNIPAQRARNFGTALVSLGTILLILAIVEYIVFLRRLDRDSGKKFRISLAAVAATLISLVGLLALFDLFLRIGPL